MKSRFFAAGVALLAAACGANPPTTPAPVTLRSLSITGMPSSFWAEERVQLGAQAVYSDGRTDSATERVRWVTRTLACIVDSAGMLTATSEGDCTVEASLEGVTATASVRVGAARFFTVSGRVREEFGIGQPAMTGAPVVVVSGAKAGQRVETNTAGMFTVANLPREPVQLRIEPEGYAPISMTAAPGSPPLDVLVSPQLVVDERSFPIAGSWRSTVVEIPFTVRHRGPFVLRLTANTQQCEVSYQTVFEVQLLQSGVRVVSLCPNWNLIGMQPPALAEDRRILEPGDYMVRVFSANWCCSGEDRRMYLSYPR